MSEVFSSIGYQLGLGGIGGFIVGYTLKKLSKLVVVLIGLLVIFLLYLGTSGVISINYDSLWQALANLLGLAAGAVGWIVGVISVIPFLGSFFAGFFLGFKLG